MSRIWKSETEIGMDFYLPALYSALPSSEIVEVHHPYRRRKSGSCAASASARYEFGHWCGLADLYGTEDSSLTMYGYADYGETYKRTLTQGDINGLKARAKNITDKLSKVLALRDPGKYASTKPQHQGNMNIMDHCAPKVHHFQACSRIGAKLFPQNTQNPKKEKRVQLELLMFFFFF